MHLSLLWTSRLKFEQKLSVTFWELYCTPTRVRIQNLILHGHSIQATYRCPDTHPHVFFFFFFKDHSKTRQYWLLRWIDHSFVQFVSLWKAWTRRIMYYFRVLRSIGGENIYDHAPFKTTDEWCVTLNLFCFL